MFFVLYVNDDHHAYDNVMKETCNITRIRGHVFPYCLGMPPWKEWFQFVRKYDSNFLPVTNQKTLTRLSHIDRGPDGQHRCCLYFSST